MKTVKPPLPSRTHDQARVLRSRSTEAELKIWQRLRAGRLGRKFRRQHPIPPYIVDFCCIDAWLIIELDGSQHGESDARRTATLQAAGFTLLRFWDNDALMRTDAVLEAIVNALSNPNPLPNPSPAGRGALPPQDPPDA